MSEVRILSPRPAPRVTAWTPRVATALARGNANAPRPHLSAVEIGDAIRAGAAQMAARIRAGDAARSRPPDGLVERARHIERGATPVRQPRRGCRLRRQARP